MHGMLYAAGNPVSVVPLASRDLSLLRREVIVSIVCFACILLVGEHLDNIIGARLPNVIRRLLHEDALSLSGRVCCWSPPSHSKCCFPRRSSSTSLPQSLPPYYLPPSTHTLFNLARVARCAADGADGGVSGGGAEARGDAAHVPRHEGGARHHRRSVQLRHVHVTVL